MAIKPITSGHKPQGVMMDKEKLAVLILKHGFATGHGDTVADLINALDEQLTALAGKRVVIGNLRSLTEADNYNDYANKMVFWKGAQLTTVGNLLAECIENA